MGFCEWLCGWEKIEYIPNWLERAFGKAFNRAGYNHRYYFRGKTFRYQAVVTNPKYQGHIPVTFYKKLRKKK